MLVAGAALLASACTIHRTIVIHHAAPAATSSAAGASTAAQNPSIAAASHDAPRAPTNGPSAAPMAPQFITQPATPPQMLSMVITRAPEQPSAQSIAEMHTELSAAPAQPRPAASDEASSLAPSIARASTSTSDDYAARYRGAREFLLTRRAIDNADGGVVTNGFALTFAGQPYRGMFTPVELTADGGSFVAFNERRSGYDFVPRLARLDASGSVRWIARLPELHGHRTYEVNGVFVTADGGALAVYCPYIGQRPQSFVVAKISAAGQLEWRTQMPQVEGYPVFLHGGRLDSSGDIQLSGHYQRLRSPDEELQGWRATLSSTGRIVSAAPSGDLVWNMTDRPTMHPSWHPVYRPYGQ